MSWANGGSYAGNGECCLKDIRLPWLFRQRGLNETGLVTKL